MTKNRFLSLALLMQVILLILLVQTWFTLSMQIDSRTVSLGSFDGASAFPVTMPLALFSLVAILIALISAGKTAYAAVIATASANLVVLALTIPSLLVLDLSALDSQLDRLTGIANTHGLDELVISTSLASPVWIVANLIAVALLLYSFRLRKSWQKVESITRLPNGAKRTTTKEPDSTIDLWDSQRG